MTAADTASERATAVLGTIRSQEPAGRAVRAGAAAVSAGVAFWWLLAPSALQLVLLAAAAATLGGVSGMEAPAARVARGAAAGVAFTMAAQEYFEPPLDLFIFGAAVGALYGLLAVGIILIYRTNRIINFAAAAIGAVPAIAGIFFYVLEKWSVPYFLVLPAVLVSAAAVGAVVDITIIRRFSTAPRLILTVATIGISQILAFFGIQVPIWMGSKGELQSLTGTPWSNLFRPQFQGRDLMSGDHVFTFVCVFGVAIGLAAFFRYTRIGIALRASAENSDRASLLGIPVGRVQTVAWGIAGLLAGLVIFLRAPLVGVPVDGSLGYTVLVYALAAAVIARMENTVMAIFAGMAVGVIEQGSVVKTGSSSFATAVMLVLILGALLLQRGRLSRAFDAGGSSWQAVKEFRPIPNELRRFPEVWGAKTGLLLSVAALAVAAPWLVGDPNVDLLTQLPLDAVIAVSLVLLAGWAGQISLGQLGLVGVSAGIVGGLVANQNIDFFAAVVLGALIGAATAFILGIPALRVQGLYLAVATLAFAAAVEGYILREDFLGKHFLPDPGARIERPLLWGRLDIASKHRFYFVCLAFLVLAVFAARSFRRNRSGRVLISVRDNQRAAPAYAINLARTKLAAFGVSGALAGLAGVLFAYQQQTIDYGTYGMAESVEVFIYTVVGGLTSIGGGIAGAVVFGALKLFGEDLVEGLSFLATGVGVLVILLFVPGGLAELFYRGRDQYLTWVANRRGILVPSLVADKRVDEEQKKAELEIIEHAEEHQEELDHLAELEPSIVCPVCEETLTLSAATSHEHLMAEQEPAGAGAASGGGGRSRLGRAKEGRR